MTDLGNAVTAILKLDATDFDKGIGNAVSAIEKLQSATKSTKSFDKLASSLETFRKELGKLESATKVSDSALNQLSENITRVGNALTVIKEFETEVNIFKQMSSAIGQLRSSMQGLADLTRGQVYNAIYGLNTVLSRAEYHLERLSGLGGGAKAFNTFANGLVKTESSLSGFASKTGAVEIGIQKMVLAFQQVTGAIRIFSDISKEVTVFNKFANGVYKISESLERFKVATSSAATSFSTIGSAVGKYQNQLNQLQVKQEQLNNTTNEVNNTIKRINTTMELASTSTNMYSNSLNRLISSTNSSAANLSTLGTKIATTMNGVGGLSGKLSSANDTAKGMKTVFGETSNSVTRLGSSSSSAAGGMNTLNNSVAKSSYTAKAADGRFKTLSGTLFTLRGMSSLVGAMFAFNLAQGFIEAAEQSITAKSTMEAYLNTMNLSENSISRFNKKLDETVKTYQKMNKYSLGDTVAGLGIEFNLSEKQMEGMMATVARLQSEYIRAGRSAEEADLAVKDIMQGEFLRLSRETGVGKNDLTALGWSGDTKDIEGLQRALDKVAEQRNWDKFAQQATSLTDVLQILKNRFGEFTAELTSLVTPGIVGSFNTINNTLQGFINWFSGSSFFTQGMTEFLGLASAIGVFATALISYKAEMGLAEIAQAGFLRSLAGVILGFDKEAIAGNTASTMLKAWVAGTDTATASSMSFVGALGSKILGLNSASVATNGLSTALIGMARGYEVAENGMFKFAEGTRQYAEAEAKLNSILDAMGIKINLSSKDIEMYAAKFEAAGIQGLSFTQKLATLNKEVSDVEASTMGATESLKAFAGSGLAAGIASAGVFAAVLVALAAAFAVCVDITEKGKREINAFNDAVENGDDYIQDAANTMNYYDSRLAQARQNKANAKEGTTEYTNAVNYEKQAIEDSRMAHEQYNATLESVQHARSVQTQIDLSKSQTQMRVNDKLSKTYEKLGMSKSEANQAASWDLVDAGSKREYRYAQRYDDFLDKRSDQGQEHAVMLKNMGYGNEKSQKYLKEYNEEMENTADAWDKWNHGDWGAGFGAWIGDRKLDWMNWSSWLDASTQDFGKAWDALKNFDGNPLEGITSTIQGDPSKLIDSILGEGTTEGVSEWFNNNITQPLSAAWNNFMSDPLGSIGGAVMGGLGWLLDSLFGEGTTDALSQVWQWLNNSFILPLQEAWSQFTSDPLGYLQGLVLDLNSFLTNLFGGQDPLTAVWNWVNTNIIQPFSQSIQNGLANIPILGDVLQMLGLIDGADSTSSDKGKKIGDAFKKAVEDVIGSIPIVGDVLRILGLIDSTDGTANQKGKNVGTNIKEGEKAGHTGTSKNVLDEMNDVIHAISQSVGNAFNTAKQVGNAIWLGINSVLQRHSPGFIYEQVKDEFQNALPSAIAGATESVYTNAMAVGQAMVSGVVPSAANLGTQVNTALSQVNNIPQLDPSVMQMLDVQGMDANINQDALAQYQTDATQANMINTTTAQNTQTTFTGLKTTLDTTFQQMGQGMVTSYTQMNTQQGVLLTNLANNNKNAYTQMQTQTTTSLNNMRNSTQNVTTQMVGAWVTMKNNIVSAAQQLKSESTTHFNELSSTIGSFYRKLQNPSNWGAGDPNSTTRYTNRGRYNRGIKAMSRVSGAGGKSGGGRLRSQFTPTTHGAGAPNKLPQNMKLNNLIKMICPDGSCMSGDVDVNKFLSSFTNGGFGSWSGWHTTHYNKIKDISDEWDAKAPQIMGWIDTNTNFKVKRFENGKPNIAFSEFKTMAESLFSAIPYDHYYDSSKCGNWVDALKSGSVNCSDGSDALIALARTCGFDAHKVHGSWNGEGHYWAVVNGQKMDTTGWQLHRTWTPSQSAGPSSKNMDVGNTTNNSYKVSVVIEGDVYGVEDLDNKISEGVKKGMSEAMNPSAIIGI